MQNIKINISNRFHLKDSEGNGILFVHDIFVDLMLYVFDCYLFGFKYKSEKCFGLLLVWVQV